MAEIELNLPQFKLQLSGGAYPESVRMVVAGGREPQGQWLKQASAGIEVSCADKGAVYCLQAGIVPWLLCGDGDSAGREVYAELEQGKTEIVRFNPLKDDTDLQLLLTRQGKANLLASGIWGGRFDHLYSNIYSLLAYKKLAGSAVILADEREFMLLFSKGEQAKIRLPEPEKVKAVSLLPLTPKVQVSISGVHWPLQEAELEMLHPYAISNVALEDVACSCQQGDLGLYFCLAE